MTRRIIGMPPASPCRMPYRHPDRPADLTEPRGADEPRVEVVVDREAYRRAVEALLRGEEPAEADLVASQRPVFVGRLR